MVDGNMKWVVYFIKYWVPVFILFGIIYWMSGGDFTDGRTSEFFFPKIKSVFPGLSPESVTLIHEAIRAFAHVIEFFVLGLFLSLAVYRSPLKIAGFKKTFLIIILLFIFTLADELRQTLVALRTASLEDVVLDMAGGVLGLIIVQRSKFNVQG